MSALARALAERVKLVTITVGRRGLLGYLKALGGSNVVKIVPSDSRLKVICGANTSYLDDGAWIKEATTTRKGVKGGTPLTTCEVRVSPFNTVKPNIGAIELAHALTRVLPFTSSDDNRPVQKCVNFEVKEGKLVLVATDSYSLAWATLNFDEGEAQALISRDNLKGVANALKRANRARISFEAGGEAIGGYSLIIDTELIGYKWASANGEFANWRKLVPDTFAISAQFDTVEAIKGVNSLKAFIGAKGYPIDLTIGNGKIVMADAEGKAEADISADTTGEGKLRVDGKYLTQALKACGGMVELGINNAYSPMLFSSNGYQVVVMPMLTNQAKEQAEKARKEKAEKTAPKGEAEQAEKAEKAKAVAEAERVIKAHKPKRKHKAKEPVPV